MSRITAPVIKFTRAMSLNATSAARPTVVDVHHNSSSLMPKYAELLSARCTEEHSRGMRTTHGPRSYKLPRQRPLMQTFSAPASTSTTGGRHIDSAIMPTIPATPTPADADIPRFANTSDNTANTELLVVATDPSVVQPATPLMSVQSTSDAEELSYSGNSKSKGEYNNTMFSDIWKGLVEDVVDGVQGKKAHA